MGHKWNAYDCVRFENKFIFNTAWSHPGPVIKEIAKLFPNLYIKYAFADEDIGNNLGAAILFRGTVKYLEIEDKLLNRVARSIVRRKFNFETKYKIYPENISKIIRTE